MQYSAGVQDQNFPVPAVAAVTKEVCSIPIITAHGSWHVNCPRDHKNAITLHADWTIMQSKGQRGSFCCGFFVEGRRNVICWTRQKKCTTPLPKLWRCLFKRQNAKTCYATTMFQHIFVLQCSHFCVNFWISFREFRCHGTAKNSTITKRSLANKQFWMQPAKYVSHTALQVLGGMGC